jgi:DNA-directed RNA polymerase subunit M/transcription elongation factor TFIIS
MKCPKCDKWIWTNEDARKEPKLKCPLCGALVKHPYRSGEHEPIEKEG